MPRRTYGTRYRRRTYRSRRRTFKRNFRRKRYNRRGQRIFPYTRYTGRYGIISISNISNTFFAFNFSLNDLPNYTEFTALYDMYKINAVKINFIPQQTQSISIGAINNAAGNARFFSAIDYNDGSVPGSIDELREYKTCKYTPIFKQHSRMIYKPKILDRGGAYSVTPWISTLSPDQDYFGLKVGIEAMGSSTTTEMLYSVEAKFYLSFKNVK